MTFNLDATLGLPFVFTFGGEDYTLPPDADMTTMNLLDEGKLDDALHRLLGDEQWERLESAPETFGLRAFTALINAYMEHLGIEPGKSGASPPSSETTAGPLKPTSNASTKSRSRGSVTVRTV